MYQVDCQTTSRHWSALFTMSGMDHRPHPRVNRPSPEYTLQTALPLCRSPASPAPVADSAQPQQARRCGQNALLADQQDHVDARQSVEAIFRPLFNKSNSSRQPRRKMSGKDISNKADTLRLNRKCHLAATADDMAVTRRGISNLEQQPSKMHPAPAPVAAGRTLLLCEGGETAGCANVAAPPREPKPQVPGRRHDIKPADIPA